MCRDISSFAGDEEIAGDKIYPPIHLLVYMSKAQDGQEFTVFP